MEEDSLHVFVVVGVRVAMAMVVITVIVPMPVVGMSESCEADNIDEKTEDADDKEFVEAL